MEKIFKFHSFSIATEENTEIYNTAELLIFIREIDLNYNVSE